MNAQLAPVMDDTGIEAYTATDQGLAELRARLAGRVYDVTTGKGMDEARKDRAECRSLRVDHAAAQVLNAALGVRYTGMGAHYPQPFDPRDAERLAEIERDHPELFA